MTPNRVPSLNDKTAELLLLADVLATVIGSCAASEVGSAENPENRIPLMAGLRHDKPAEKDNNARTDCDRLLGGNHPKTPCYVRSF